MDLTSSEILVLGLFVSAIIIQMVASYSKRETHEFWNPMTIISLVYLYYCVVGPVKFVIDGEYIFRNVNHRPFLFVSWLGALLSYLGTVIGFHAAKKATVSYIDTSIPARDILGGAKKIFIIAFILLVLLGGSQFLSQLTIVDSNAEDIPESTGYTGTFMLYLIQAVVFFVSATLLSLIPFLKKQGSVWFFVMFGVTMALYVNAGFRWRIIILCYSLMSVYHLTKQIKLNWRLALGLLFPLLLLMGAMEIARGYGQGVDTKKLEGVETSQLLNSSTNEAACFIASGFVIEKYLTQYDFSHFDFAINAVSAPIPRALWPGKPDGSYMLGVTRGLYGGNNGIGQAVLNYAEYYMAFGWFGVFIFPFLMGMFLGRCWSWFLKHRFNDYAVVLISIINAMMYVWISRGYLSQFVTLFILACLPVWILYRRNEKKQRFTAKR